MNYIILTTGKKKKFIEKNIICGLWAIYTQGDCKFDLQLLMRFAYFLFIEEKYVYLSSPR